MKKIGLNILGVIIIIFVLIKLVDIPSYRTTIDWQESYNEKSTKPYGVSVFYKELPRLFKDQKVRTVYHYPGSYLFANSVDGYGDHVAEGIYMIIGNSDYLEYDDVDELLDFTSRGNTLFISDFQLPQQLQDTLKVRITSNEKLKDSTSLLTFTNTRLTNKSTKIDKLIYDVYFEHIDQPSYKTLGHVEGSSQEINFVEIPFYDGKIVLHLEPKVFTNYNILKEERYKYVEGVLNYLPSENVYFDSYTKMYNYDADVEQVSDLSWFLDQLAFRWAWFLALLLTFLFVIFNAKRRQRIIKTIKPLENTTVGFVKTISNLYYETNDHKNIIDKKITYFLEKIRTDYNLDTSKLDNEFIDKLVQKSGKKPEHVTKVIKHINWLRSKNEFFEENLINLNRYIEAFYSD